MKYMQNFGLYLVLFFVGPALLFAAMRAHAAPGTIGDSFSEPLFGLNYSQSYVHFDTLQSAQAFSSCKENLKNDPLPSTVAVFAQYKTATEAIYIVGLRDNFGIFVISDGHCNSGNPGLALAQKHHLPPLRGDAPSLSDAEVTALFRDAMARYTKAFGNKAHFFQWLDSGTERMRSGCKGMPDLWCPPTYHSLPANLQSMLEAYRGNDRSEPW